MTWEQLECDNRGESGSCESNYLPSEMGGGEGGLFQVLLLTCWTGPIGTANVDPGFFAANMRWEIFLEILNLWCGVVCSFVEGKNVIFGIDGFMNRFGECLELFISCFDCKYFYFLFYEHFVLYRKLLVHLIQFKKHKN